MRISRFFAGGLASVAVVVSLSGCVGAPALAIYGGLSDRCFETRMTADGSFAVVSITVLNDSPRSMILREARVLQLVNARVDEITVVPMPSAYTIFGVAPGGRMSTDQRTLYRDREQVDGAVIKPGDTVEVLIELRADNNREYAGLRGLRVKYDDGWFSATSTADAVIGFVPPRARCGSQNP